MSLSINSLKEIDNEIETLLNEIAKEEGLKDYKIEKTPGAVKGDGYLGVITAVSITGKATSGKEKVIHLIVKSATKSEAVRTEAPLSKAFEREIYMYSTVLPAFLKFETDKKLQSFSSWAKCYKTCMLEKSEALIMENLKENGYRLWDRMKPMDGNHVSVVMAEYGRFHAFSLAMRDQDEERFRKLTKNMDDIFGDFMDKDAFGKIIHTHAKKGLDCLHSVADKLAHTKFSNLLGSNLDNFIKSLSKSVDNHSVILHGDCWTNNMMFKYDDKNDLKKPTKMCIIDLQISRLGSPILDLSYYFFACCSKEVLDNHEHYLNVYYNSLSDHLRKLGSDPEKVFPKSVYKEHWKKFSRFGLILSTLLIHIMLSKQDEVADLTEVAESGTSVADAFNYDIKDSDVYQDRVKHNILHCVKNGYI